MRLFVAVWPPPAVLDLIAELPRPDSPGVRWTARAQWHVTLRFLGEVATVDEVVAALGSRPLPAARASTGAVRRLGPGVLCVDIEGLGPLAEAVIKATAEVGRPPESRAFHGHLTLARASRRGGILRGLAGAPLGKLEFPVLSVAVVRSHLARQGARYETAAEVACGG